MGKISRNPTRIIRHVQRPADGPPIPLTLRREAYVQNIVGRPLFQQFDTDEADLVQLANDVDDDQKRLMKVISDGPTQSYMWGGRV